MLSSFSLRIASRARSSTFNAISANNCCSIWGRCELELRAFCSLRSISRDSASRRSGELRLRMAAAAAAFPPRARGGRR
uniref:Uncharacterized protein n=1 Tax=Arundo donax TaxID=35708 RepID=A0A0A9F5Z7_ARUDO